MARSRLVTRTFALATMATFTYFMAVGMSVAVVSRFIDDELGGNGFHVGLAAAVFSGVAIIARPAIARLGGTIGLARTMALGAAIGTVGLVLTAAAPSVWALLPLRAITGVAEATVFVGGLAIVSRQAPANRQAEAASFYSLAVFGGITLGPVVGEAVLGEDRFALAFVVAAGWCALAGVVALAVPVGIGRGDLVARGGPLVHRGAIAPGLVLACGIAALTGFMAFTPTYAKELDMGGAAPVFALYGVICLIVRLLGARLPERVGLARTATASLVLLCSGLAVAALIASPGGLYAGAAGVALGLSLLYPPLMATTVATVPDNERTSALATFSAFFEVGAVTGGLLLGGLAALSGERAAFAGGAVIALTGLVFLRSLLAGRRRAAADHRSTAMSDFRSSVPTSHDTLAG